MATQTDDNDMFDPSKSPRHCGRLNNPIHTRVEHNPTGGVNSRYLTTCVKCQDPIPTLAPGDWMPKLRFDLSGTRYEINGLGMPFGYWGARSLRFFAVWFSK